MSRNVNAHTQKVINPKKFQSRFFEWPTPLLRELLVHHGIEVKGANRAPHDFIVKVCDEVFAGEPLPPEPPQLTFAETIILNRAALQIQRKYIKKKAAEIELLYEQAHVQQNRRLVSDQGTPVDLHDRDNTSSRRATTAGHMMAAESSMMKPDHKAANVTKMNRKQLDDEIEKPWHRPSVKYAQQFHAENHPHHAGKKKQPYNWRATTLGRHCVMDGCGSQLDLWDEGQVSEFAQFGSGVTNYFKFLKWCCWVFFILSVINIPAMIINSFGVQSAYGGFSLAATTIGNLGDNSTLTTVRIPGCDPDMFQQDTCELKKESLAYYYSCLDCFGTIFVMLGWLWLRAFEKKEVDNLNRSTVTASDYTVRLPWIPKDTTETQLKGHFAMVTGHAVADVALAYDNAQEIELYFQRGALMKKRFLCVQKIRYHKTMAAKYGDHMLDSGEMMEVSERALRMTRYTSH